MRPTLYTVDLPGPGPPSTMAKPRGGDRLKDEMTALRNHGVGILICSPAEPELTGSGLATEAREARDAGLHFVEIPIPDARSPISRSPSRPFDGSQSGCAAVAHRRTLAGSGSDAPLCRRHRS
jgi:hypothetical protein